MRNPKNVRDNIVEEKYSFCTEFEKEMGLQNGAYSEDIFDFIYNIYSYKRIFKGKKFEQVLSDVFDMDFSKFVEVSNYIQQIYNEMVYLNRDYFFSVFKFNHEDPDRMGHEFMKNLSENYSKFMEHF